MKTRGNALIVKATGRRIPLYACKRPPTFRQCFGRTWDRTTLVLDGQQSVQFWWDTTWGAWAYGELGGRWWKVAVRDIESNFHIEVTLED